MSIRQNFLESFLFKDKKSFGELLIGDIDAEIETLYKSIANTKEAISRYSINLENLKPFVSEPMAYKKKQLDISRKTLRKSKDLLAKNTQLLKQVETKLESVEVKKTKEKLQQDLGIYGYQALVFILKNYKEILTAREKELQGNIVTLEQDINVISKFDEKVQAIDLESKILVNQKLVEKEQSVVQDVKMNIKQLQKLQEWIKSTFK